jgi:hypothetical protein
MREVVAHVLDQYQPGDVIADEPDTGFGYYYRQTDQPTPLWNSDEALARLQFLHPKRVWLITFGRDATRSTTNAALQDWLGANYHLASEEGYVEQDPTYRQVKEWLLHRPAYRYKLLVQVFAQ